MYGNINVYAKMTVILHEPSTLTKQYCQDFPLFSIFILPVFFINSSNKIETKRQKWNEVHSTSFP